MITAQEDNDAIEFRFAADERVHFELKDGQRTKVLLSAVLEETIDVFLNLAMRSLLRRLRLRRRYAPRPVRMQLSIDQAAIESVLSHEIIRGRLTAAGIRLRALEIGVDGIHADLEREGKGRQSTTFSFRVRNGNSLVIKRSSGQWDTQIEEAFPMVQVNREELIVNHGIPQLVVQTTSKAICARAIVRFSDLLDLLHLTGV
ncbi:MAG: hypothetical protein H6807_15265 [Planctomycetes bacterium]|nr:hypothetical protein [Planctomycetota bacterium]